MALVSALDWALDRGPAKRGLWGKWRPEVWEGHMGVEPEVVARGNVSSLAERP